MIAVLVPVLGRPQNAGPLAASLAASTTVPHRLIWLVSPGDHDQRDACRDAGGCVSVVSWYPAPGDFARKINYGLRITDQPFIFQAADDVEFTPCWDVNALAVADRTGAGVVGTNDDANPLVRRGDHSTHSLIRRSYVLEQGASLDGPGSVFSEAYGHQWCNTPDAPIWMSDLTFRAIGDLREGDEVVGWQRLPTATSSLNRLTTGTVLAISTRRAPTVRVETESGKVMRCTPDHLWLNGRYSPSMSKPGRSGNEWVPAETGRTLLRVIEIPNLVAAEHQRLAGWMGGIYDGEGTGIYAAMQSAEANPDVVAQIDHALQTLGISYTRGTRPPSEKLGRTVEEFILNGGRQGYLDFLLKVEPVKRDGLVGAILGTRYGNRVRKRVLGAGAARFGKRDKVVSVTPAGEDDVVSLTTTTGNYVAWGYASKNCDNELVGLARARGEWAFAAASVVRHRHPIFDRSVPTDATYARGSRSAREDARLFRERSKAWA